MRIHEVRKNVFGFRFVAIIKDNMDQVHQQLDMAVVAILSHGENGSIICTNGEKVNIQLYIYTNHN